MSLHALTIYARQAEAALEHAALITRLQSSGLLGARLEPQLFLAGARLFEHISFLGCAPHIPLDPGESEHFLRIFVPQLSRPRLLAAHNARTPACRHCRVPLEAWRTELDGDPEGIQCPSCHQRLSAAELNLGKQACYSQYIIQLSPVFEGEAIPAHGLLRLLEEQFDTPFAYAYTAHGIT